MNLYANGFKCSAKNDGSEIILTFTQESPEFDDKGEISGSTVENVSSLVLPPHVARALADALDEYAPEAVEGNK